MWQLTKMTTFTVLCLRRTLPEYQVGIFDKDDNMHRCCGFDAFRPKAKPSDPVFL